VSIHPTACVDPAAEVDPQAEIGPYCVVGPHVRLARGVVLRSHVCVSGRTEIGEGTQIFPFAAIGEQPQDLKFRGEETRLLIGARNLIREHATVHPGTADGGGLTAIGDDNWLMIGTHVGHDCRIGNHVMMGNAVQLAGHVSIADYAYVQASAAVQQFLRIGESAFVAAKAGVMQDIAPFSWCQGHPTRVLRMNRVGLERRGYTAEQIEPVEAAYRLIFRSKLSPRESLARARALWPQSAEVERLVAFLEKSERGFARVRQ
jgi:UDP-N-acetylglucosamine acyltransferase